MTKMFFRNAETHARIQQFDALQQIADEALRRPGVQQQLGELGVRIATLNREAFLPDVRHAVVSAPRCVRNTNRMGLLPYLPTDHSLRPHDSLLQPTPARRANIRGLLREAGLDNSRHRTQRFIRQRVANIDQEEREKTVNPRTAAGAGAASYHHTDTGILIAGRPLVGVKVQELPEHPVLRAAVLAHEWVHAGDVETASSESIYYSAWTEFRAYHVGALVHKEAIAAGQLSMDQAENEDPVTVQVEEIRQHFGIDGDALLNGGLQISEKHDGAVLELWLMGAAELF
jgi:hypothetical protein